MEQTETKTEFLRFLGIDMKFTIVMRFSEGSCRWQDDDPFFKYDVIRLEHTQYGMMMYLISK